MAITSFRSEKGQAGRLDDAHLMDLANLRKLRFLFEDFPKNHNLVTCSVITKRLNSDCRSTFSQAE